MQTSQVSNQANLITSQPAPSRQADAASSDAPFGKVLSREIAGRNASEGNRPQARESGNATHAKQPTKNDGKAADAKVTKDARQARAADDAPEADGVAADAALQASEDMLALVANLAQIATPAGELPVEETAQQLAAEATTTLNPVASMNLATPVVPLAQPVDPTLTAANPAPETDLTNGIALGAGRRPIARDLPETATHSQAPNLTTAELEAKGRDLLGSATAAAVPGQTASVPAQEFTSAMKESLSTLNATSATNMAPIQQAAVHAAQSMGDNAVERLTPRVGTPAWDQALGQKVVWMVAGEHQSASLTLNPPDLGPLQVVLNVSNSQATATFTAAQPEVRQALEAAMPKLREMLGEAGIQLGQASVNSGSPNQQGAFEQNASSSHGHGHRSDSAEGAEAPRVSRVRPASIGQGMVDTFA